MKLNLYKAARILTTAGITADIKFIPTQVTSRLRKSIQRQIVSGHISGGWSSHASRIAKVLCEQFELSYLHKDYWGYYARFTTPEAQEEAVRILRADMAAYVLSGDYNAHMHYNPKYLVNTKRELEQDVVELTRGNQVHVRLRNDDLSKEFVECFIKSRNADQIKAANKVADMLNYDKPIYINMNNWKE